MSSMGGSITKTTSRDRDLEGASRLVRAEYLEMPGLCLTGPQVRRLFAFDVATCRGVLSKLVLDGVLRATRGGKYVLARSARSAEIAGMSSPGDMSSPTHEML